MLDAIRRMLRPEPPGVFHEPWSVVEAPNLIEETHFIATVDAERRVILSSDQYDPRIVPAEIQRRIAACVNFCRNIDTDTLERLRPPPNPGAAEY